MAMFSPPGSFQRQFLKSEPLAPAANPTVRTYKNP